MSGHSLRYSEANDKAAMTRCAFAIIAPLVIGCLGFWWIEPGWSLWDSLYFTLVTVTTVGYGDRGLSLDGERFAAILLVCGIAVYTYALGTLVQIATHSDQRWKWKMQKRISKLRGHAIICGYGRMGEAVCKNLKSHDFPFVILDSDSAVYESAINDGYLAVMGSASEDAVLSSAGVEHASVVICVVDSDSQNSFIAMCVRELNPDAVIACRCESTSSTSKLRRAGASFVVSPHEMAGGYLSDSIIKPHITELFDHCGTSSALSLAEIEIQPDSGLIGQTVKSYGMTEPSMVFVAAARHGEKPTLRPRADRRFEPFDVLIVAADHHAIERLKTTTALEPVEC